MELGNIVLVKGMKTLWRVSDIFPEKIELTALIDKRIHYARSSDVEVLPATESGHRKK